VITAVTEDVTYVAEFKESVKSTENPYFQDEKGSFYLRVVLVIIAVILILVGIPVAIVLVVKNKKKKKAIAETSEISEGSKENDDSEDKTQE
jgi:cytoskeletal protein RodZ